MTREEAIERMKTMRWEHSTNPCPDRTAFDMAIKALEQESCDKCIYSTSKGECQYDDIAETIPTEQEPKTEWILVSERLPENRTYVLTTIHVPGRQPHARSGWYENGLFMNDNGDTWKASDIEVKAWQPLPKAYEEE